MMHSMFGMKAAYFAQASEVPTDDHEKLPFLLWGKIPPSATNIFVCYGGRDLTVLCAMSVPHYRELVMVAEELVGVSFEQFREINADTDIFHSWPDILASIREAKMREFWDIDKVTNGREYSTWEVDRHKQGFFGGGRTVVIDTERKRIYFYYWST